MTYQNSQFESKTFVQHLPAVAGPPGGNSEVSSLAPAFDFKAIGGSGGTITGTNASGGGGSATGATTSVITPGQSASGVAGGGSFYASGGYTAVQVESTVIQSLSSKGGLFGGGGAGTTDFFAGIVSGGIQATNGGDGIVMITYVQRVG
jgi:hypothetical protein